MRNRTKPSYENFQQNTRFKNLKCFFLQNPDVYGTWKSQVRLGFSAHELKM